MKVSSDGIGVKLDIRGMVGVARAGTRKMDVLRYVRVVDIRLPPKP